MITYTNMTPSQTFEERIVAIPLALTDDQSSIKICFKINCYNILKIYA